jgi:pimeloyl-ACP methyl ester carboxylesterase
VNLKIPAIVGGTVGAVSAIAAAGAVHEHRQISRERSKIDPKSSARFGALPIDRQSRVVAADGVALHTEEVGPRDAPLTVLFVHGFTLNLQSFHFQRLAIAEALGDQVRMVFYDQRSHGRSDKSATENCTIEQLGRDLAGVIEALIPTGAIMLVGHSMGGMTVMSLAGQHPELFAGVDRPGRISHVALINTSSGELKTVTLGLPAAVARMRGPILPIVLRRAAKNVGLVEKGRLLGRDVAWLATKRLSFASKDVDPAVVAFCTQMISATPVDVVAAFYPTLMDHDGTEGLANLRGCSVLVIAADHDALTPHTHSEAIAAALPDSQLITVAESGHLLMLERPDAVDQPLLTAVRAALDDASSRRRWRVRPLRRVAR